MGESGDAAKMAGLEVEVAGEVGLIQTLSLDISPRKMGIFNWFLKHNKVEKIKYFSLRNYVLLII